MTTDDFTKAKLWGGRFTGATDPLMHKFNCSIHTWGRQMYDVDVDGSIAYSKGLLKAGVLNEHEQKVIERGLNIVREEWASGRFAIADHDEDIFTANERRLSEIIGKDIGGKLHTGRSRNDQTATDARLWLMREVVHVKDYLHSLINVCTTRAESEIDVLMPGYTHLQRAQPIRWSHWLLSHTQSLLLDYQRLLQLMPRIANLPLGSGALAGNPFSIDRELLRQELGFETIGQNSMHMVSDRDFVIEFLQWATLLTVHTSRFAEDLINYSSSEFGFVQLSDAYSTGSSIMPQKKNPDSLEIIRGKAGRVFGSMSTVVVALKGLPTTYNKDMAEDKDALFDCVHTVQDVIRIFDGVISTLKINPAKMSGALSSDMLATDLAEYLVRRGVPFRETHHVSGQVVAYAEAQGCQMSDLSYEQLRSIDPRFEEDVLDVFDFEASVERRNAVGGPAKARVQEQIVFVRQSLE